MDTVLDTLLDCLRDLVPFDKAAVILAENEIDLYVARESPKPSAPKPISRLRSTDNILLQRLMIERKSIFVTDTMDEHGWQKIDPLAGCRCWIGIPLTTSKGIFGLLSVGAIAPRKFTQDHVRFAKSLAIPAAAAIYNARLYEYATIYSAELETHIKKTQ